jgi:hypothetical protein
MWAEALGEYEKAKSVLDTIHENSSSANGSKWSYVDPFGNPYDVTEEKAHIEEHISRMHAALSGTKE